MEPTPAEFIQAAQAQNIQLPLNADDTGRNAARLLVQHVGLTSPAKLGQLIGDNRGSVKHWLDQGHSRKPTGNKAVQYINRRIALDQRSESDAESESNTSESESNTSESESNTSSESEIATDTSESVIKSAEDEAAEEAKETKEGAFEVVEETQEEPQQQKAKQQSPRTRSFRQPNFDIWSPPRRQRRPAFAPYTNETQEMFAPADYADSQLQEEAGPIQPPDAPLSTDELNQLEMNDSAADGAGFVYVMADRRDRCKIGSSTDPPRRFRQLRTGNPSLRLISSFSFGQRLTSERTMHGFLARQGRHCQGEFYYVTPEEAHFAVMALAEDRLTDEILRSRIHSRSSVAHSQRRIENNQLEYTLTLTVVIPADEVAEQLREVFSATTLEEKQEMQPAAAVRVNTTPASLSTSSALAPITLKDLSTVHHSNVFMPLIIEAFHSFGCLPKEVYDVLADRWHLVQLRQLWPTDFLRLTGFVRNPLTFASEYSEVLDQFYDGRRDYLKRKVQEDLINQDLMSFDDIRLLLSMHQLLQSV